MNTFHFFSSLCYDLIYPLFCNLVYFIASVLYHTRHNLCCLVNSSSTCVSKVIGIQESSYLSFCSSINFSVFFLIFVCVVSCSNFKCSGSTTKKSQNAAFFYFNRKTHKHCSLLQISFIVSSLNFDVIKLREFVGIKASIPE